MVDNLVKTLASLSPFNFLQHQEIQLLVKAGVIKTYHAKQVVYSIHDKEHDTMSILLSGVIRIVKNKKVITTVQAVSYFGERSALFKKQRSANVVALSKIECLELPGSIIRDLIKANKSFSHAFAEKLHDKHMLFGAYHEFVTLIYKYRHEETVNLVDLVPYYLELDPLLHQNAKSDDINFNALKYAVSRLPVNITNISHFFLSDYLPSEFLDKVNLIRHKTRRAKKRLYLDILPGKLFVVLRDEMTDYIDFVTKLCIYYCETQKIIKKLSFSPIDVSDGSNYIANEIIKRNLDKIDHEKDDRDILASLPLSDIEKKKLSELFESHITKHLYDIIAQNGYLDIHIKKPDARYITLSSEVWLKQVQIAYEKLVNQQSVLEQDHEIHIIFSNTHSVNNCLSSWIHEHQQDIMTWGKKYKKPSSTVEDPSDQLYIYAREWLKAFPAYSEERVKADTAAGVVYVIDPSFNGIDVNFISLNDIGTAIDPHLQDIDRKKFKGKIIINIDYAYGHQAETCVKNLITLLGKKIKSISIMGKTGGITGERGDIIIPSNILLQKDNSFIPIQNQALKEVDINNVGFLKSVHRGNMLTVLGTLMQSRDMLSYYKLFWDVVGMEMEAAHYMKEINTALLTDMLEPSVKLYVAYYISDTPLRPHSNLSKALNPREGVPAVYSITRATLRRILLEK